MTDLAVVALGIGALLNVGLASMAVAEGDHLRASARFLAAITMLLFLIVYLLLTEVR
jgi:hypothetical protein